MCLRVCEQKCAPSKVAGKRVCWVSMCLVAISEQCVVGQCVCVYVCVCVCAKPEGLSCPQQSSKKSEKDQ